MPDISSQLQTLRRAKGLTIAQLAQTVGAAEEAMWRYEQGEERPAYDTLMALADYFGVSLDYLSGRTGLNFQMVRDHIHDEEGDRTTYGITVQSEGETKLLVRDISSDFTLVERLVERCSVHRVALSHVMDIIRDEVEGVSQA